MKTNGLMKKIAGGVLVLGMMVGVGMASGSTANAAERDDHGRYISTYQARERFDGDTCYPIARDRFEGTGRFEPGRRIYPIPGRVRGRDEGGRSFDHRDRR